MTPLHFASRNGHMNIVVFLVENGADIHFKNKEIHISIMEKLP